MENHFDIFNYMKIICQCFLLCLNKELSYSIIVLTLHTGISFVRISTWSRKPDKISKPPRLDFNIEPGIRQGIAQGRLQGLGSEKAPNPILAPHLKKIVSTFRGQTPFAENFVLSNYY